MDTLSDHFKLEENWFICEKSCDGNHFKSTQSDILIVRKMLLFCGVRRVLIIMGEKRGGGGGRQWKSVEKSCDGIHFKSTQSDFLIAQKMLLFCCVRRVLVIMGGGGGGEGGGGGVDNWIISATSKLPHIWSAQIIIGVGVDNGNLSF